MVDLYGTYGIILVFSTITTISIYGLITAGVHWSGCAPAGLRPKSGVEHQVGASVASGTTGVTAAVLDEMP